MTCQEAIARIDDYVDGVLSAEQSRELEAHLGTCSACRSQEQSLRSLLEQAATLPRQLEPQRDLWPGIAARLERRRRVLPFMRPWALGTWNPALAAAAVLLIALSSAVTAYLMRGSRGPTELAQAPGVTLQPTAAVAGTSSIGQAEVEYERAAQALLARLDERRDALSPETLRVVEKNLETIDAALEEVRRALREDPANPGLVRMLASTHRKRIEVLQSVVRHSRSL